MLLAQNAEGLANLQRLSSRAFLDTDPDAEAAARSSPAVAAHSDGLLLLTGGTQGAIARLLAEGQKAEAERLLAMLTEAFPDRVAMELHRHGLAVEAAIEPGLIQLADAARVPLVATNECFFATRKMHLAHDALLCIAEGRLILGEGTPPRHARALVQARRRHARAVLRPAGGLRQHLGHRSKRCAVMAEVRKPLLPMCPKVRPGASEAETLAAMAREGLDRRMDIDGADAATPRRPTVHGWTTSCR